jgi:hypothetical protein
MQLYTAVLIKVQIQGIRLSFSLLTISLFSHTCPLLAPEPSLSCPLLPGLSQWQWVFSYLVALETHTSPVATDMKHSAR